MSTTTTHVLRLSRGGIRIDITEAADVVYIVQRGVRLREDEIPRFVEWAFPILDAYRDDPRPIEMAGEHVNWTGRIELVGSEWIGRAKSRGSVQ